MSSPRVAPEHAITVEAIRAGRAVVLSIFPAGPRALCLVQGPDGRCASLHAIIDSAGRIERILGLFAFGARRLHEYAAAIEQARVALGQAEVT